MCWLRPQTGIFHGSMNQMLGGFSNYMRCSSRRLHRQRARSLLRPYSAPIWSEQIEKGRTCWVRWLQMIELLLKPWLNFVAIENCWNHALLFLGNLSVLDLEQRNPAWKAFHLVTPGRAIWLLRLAAWAQGARGPDGFGWGLCTSSLGLILTSLWNDLPCWPWHALVLTV